MHHICGDCPHIRMYTHSVFQCSTMIEKPSLLMAIGYFGIGCFVVQVHFIIDPVKQECTYIRSADIVCR